MIKKIVAVIGMPGTGKTTLMKNLFNRFEGGKPFKEGLIEGTEHVLNDGKLFVLGKYNTTEKFEGTDRLSMAVQPIAIEFLKTLQANTAVEYSLLYEGDRLSNVSFLSHCIENYNTSILFLTANSNVLKKRYVERGSNQDEKWLKGRATKYDSIASNFAFMPHITISPNENEEQSVENQNIVCRWLNG